MKLLLWRVLNSLESTLIKLLCRRRKADLIRMVNVMAANDRKKERSDVLLRWFKRTTNLQNGLTPEQIEEVKRTWGPLYDAGIVQPDWAAIYTEKTGKFSPEYIGSDLHNYYVEYKKIDFDYLRAFLVKNYMDVVLPCVKHPETFIRKVRGMYLSKDFVKLNIDAVVDMMFEERSKGLVVKISRESSGGKGVTFVDETFSKKDIRELMRSGSDLNVQYVMKQHPDMAKMNQSSINTIRIITILLNGESIPLSACVRIGSEGSKVDNFSSGGVGCGVNEDGTLKPCGYTQAGDYVEVHTNGFAFKDGKIPNYDKVLETVKKLHYCVPVFGVANWDIAIDEDGEPVLLEYNVGGGGIDIHQYNNGPLYGKYRKQIIEEVFKDFQVRGATLDYNYILFDDYAVISKGGTDVRQLTIPQMIEEKKVSRVYDNAFKDNYKLIKLIVEANLERIGASSFYGCKNLKSVVFKGGVKSIAESAFCYCSSLSQVTLPEGLETIGIRAFEGCENLRRIYIPDTVTSISKTAFDLDENVVISCKKGSYAEEYAKQHNIQFVHC